MGVDVGRILLEALQASVICTLVLALLRVMSGPDPDPDPEEVEQEIETAVVAAKEVEENEQNRLPVEPVGPEPVQTVD